MNICIFTYVYISKHRGGIERVTETLVTELTKRDHRVYIISVCKPIEDNLSEENKFTLPNNEVNSTENETFIKKFLARNKIDIILNQTEVKSLFNLITKTRNNIPLISCIHTDPLATLKATKDNWDEWKIKKGIRFWFKIPYFASRKIFQYYSRKKYISKKHREYYEKSDAVVLLSKRFKESFIKISGINDSKKLYFISNPNSYDITECTVIKKENIVLFVGRLVFQKRLDRLLRIWDRIKNRQGWKLVIVGDGPERYFYENLCIKWNIDNVEFVGHCDPTPYYQKARILCATSSHEGFGLTITEAMQHNAIPIAFNSYESIEDIISDGIDGFTIRPFSISDYSKTLKRLINDTLYREQILENIKQKNILNRYSIDKIIEKWEELLSNLQ